MAAATASDLHIGFRCTELLAVDSGNGINGATYGPTGAITGFTSGSTGGFAGITNTFSYNRGLQPVKVSASSPRPDRVLDWL